MEDVELGRFRKTPTTSVTVRITTYQDEKGVDIREFLETEKYTGLTKKGVRIPISKWKEFEDIIKKVNELK